jgi:formyl-CoA transferase
MSGTLAGIRVLDLSRVLAGPWATQLLGDFGADVVKVERPGSGDDTRHWGPPWLEGQGTGTGRESAYFLATNRNKRSLTADLSSTAGQELVRDLALQSDEIGPIYLWDARTRRCREFFFDYNSTANT